MNSLANRKCFNHQFREAAARCPECGRHFCRECVTEHEGRVLCALCIDGLAGGSDSKSRRFRWITRFFLFLSGIAGTWMFFYFIGRILLSIPDSFHEGTIWKDLWPG